MTDGPTASGDEEILLMGFDLSDNAYVRTWNLARCLSRRYRVSVLGPCFRDGRVFEPFRSEPPEPCAFDATRMTMREAESRLVAAVRASGAPLVYAQKPRPLSFGAALKGCRGARPVLLDIEDWESEGWRALTLAEKWREWRDRASWAHPSHNHWAVRWERRVGRAAGITTVSRFLQERFGGTIVVPGADCDRFQPGRWRREGRRWRERLGVGDGPVAVFAGTPFLFKGLLDVLAASRAAKHGFHLVVAGGDAWRTSTDTARIDREGGDRVTRTGWLPHREMPGLLEMADLVIINHKRGTFTAGNVPAKLAEAMAMGKPVIVSDLSEMPRLVGDAGIVVPPDDVGALARAVDRVLGDESFAKELGRRARARAVKMLSHEAMLRQLDPIVRPLIG